jgi:hypothetical protein
MYTKTSNADAIISDSGKVIPCDTGNKDYREYLVWVGNGNTPAEYVAPTIAPPTLAELLAKLAELTRQVNQLQE